MEAEAEAEAVEAALKSTASTSLSGRLEIHPCVLQDIGPLGPLLYSHSTTSHNHSMQGIGYRRPSAILG